MSIRKEVFTKTANIQHTSRRREKAAAVKEEPARSTVGRKTTAFVECTSGSMLSSWINLPYKE